MGSFARRLLHQCVNSMIEARVYCLKKEKLKKNTQVFSLPTVPAPSGVMTKPSFPPLPICLSIANQRALSTHLTQRDKNNKLSIENVKGISSFVGLVVVEI